MPVTIRIVAVTACVSGVAHTYMAAERLEKLCQQEKWQAKIETQGALGIENPLTEQDMQQASLYIQISDIQLQSAQRFAGMRGIQMTTYHFLQAPEQIIAAIKKVIVSPQGTVLKLN